MNRSRSNAGAPCSGITRHLSSCLLPLAILGFSMTPMWPRPQPPAEQEPPGQGALLATDAGGKIVPMPLRHTEVRAEISAFVARVDVVQTFGNPFDTAIEAKYVFPLPERAAVDDFLLEVGERRVRGEIHRREEAQRIYAEARASGYTAALLDQERPNIFTQSVANIPPGREVQVHLRYVDILPYADGAYRFLFPMVVGPRYTPGAASPAATAEAGGTTATTHLKPGFRTVHDIAITVDIDAGVPIRSLGSESHGIVVTRLGPSRARVTLAPGDRLPNKDLMLRWDVAGEMPEVAVLAHRADDDGFFSLLVQPKAEVAIDEAAPKEILFVLDQSGSMSGLPIEMSQRFMRLALRSLGRNDRFNIVRFDSSAAVLAPEPLPNTEDNVRRGIDAVDAMRGGGGTEMLAGFRSALAQPHDPACVRIVFFLTDGFIGNEEDIFRLIRESRADARIFTLGIGSSVNHHLLRGMADLGQGSYQYIRPDGREKEAVERFQRWVTRPYLTDLEIDWGALRVEDVHPSRLPDLYSGQTLSVVGRYLWGGSDTVIVRGRLGGVPWEKRVDVALPERSDDHAALASVWARERIHELLMRPGPTARPEIEAQVTSLALAFRLMSPFTSFVAVDDSVVANPDGNPVRVDQPLPMPEFVSFEGCFGKEDPGMGGETPLPPDIAPQTATAPLFSETRTVEGGAPPGLAVARGSVRDTSGSGIPGAVVALQSVSQAGAPARTVTDGQGYYRFAPIPPSNDYFVKVDYPGFAPIEVGPLDLEAGKVVTLDITLHTSAETTETILVEAEPRAEARTATTYNAEFIEGLPIIGHNYQDVLAVAPGVTDGDGNPNIHGARDTGVQYRHDGGNITDPVSGAFGQNLDGDIIEELEVVTGGASAEYGRADGGFANIVTKPGDAPATKPSARTIDMEGVGRARSAHPGSRWLAEAALRVLADLADDARLSRSEGLPALAGLLAAQYADGGFSASVREQAVATWALAAAAAAEPRLPWVPGAARRAAEFLTRMRARCGSRDFEGDALADLVLRMIAACKAECLPLDAGVAASSSPREDGTLPGLLAGESALEPGLVRRILQGRRAPGVCVGSR